MSENFTYLDHLKSLDLRSRNQVRALIGAEAEKSFTLINSIRKTWPDSKLATLDELLWAMSHDKGSQIPALFPVKPQTKEHYRRLDLIEASKQHAVIERHLSNNSSKVQSLILVCKIINDLIVKRNYLEASKKINAACEIYGYSHLLLRKAALVKALAPTEELAQIEPALESIGILQGSIIVKSLVQCFDESQSFIRLKRSVMGVLNRGANNKFTRDIIRIPFHPHAKDLEDYQECLQSNLQSSLIDALIFIKCNQDRFFKNPPANIAKVISWIESSAPSVNEILGIYHKVDDETEELFYQHSSCWLENSEVLSYRYLCDNFYDDPESYYINIDDSTIQKIGTYVVPVNARELSKATIITKSKSHKLSLVENAGQVARTAAFNFMMHKSSGEQDIDEQTLITLLSRTQNLDRTIPIMPAVTLSRTLSSTVSKLLLYLLISKRSNNDKDDYQLRKIVQKIAVESYSGSLVQLVDGLGQKSMIIAAYAYEVFNEEFIAKLFDIISSTQEITATRLELHKWMAAKTGTKAYEDIVRNFVIENQLNRVRNELDDNRIYVNVPRFTDWIGEELYRDVAAAMSYYDKNTDDATAVDSLLHISIESAYKTFCSDPSFGIASYLGRRIRHGTFKGHLYYGLLKNIESESRFSHLFSNQGFQVTWTAWKLAYEKSVDQIVVERLHVASPSKANGFLNPEKTIRARTDITTACAKAIVKSYVENNTTALAPFLITEFCWRLAETELRTFNTFLKGQRARLTQPALLLNFEHNVPSYLQTTAAELAKAVSRSIDEKLNAMQAWFKRPINVSPKASVTVLFKAVVEEVRGSFPDLQIPDLTDSGIELEGGAFQIVYDSFYVVVFNAAKHGKPGGIIEPIFSITREENQGVKTSILRAELSSEIDESDSEQDVALQLELKPGTDISNAQTYENRSGIPKLYHLQNTNPIFKINKITCENRKVVVNLDFRLEY